MLIGVIFTKTGAYKEADSFMVEEIAAGFPGVGKYFKFELTENDNKAMSFDQFRNKTFEFGTNNVTEHPFLYSTYQIYEANPISQ